VYELKSDQNGIEMQFIEKIGKKKDKLKSDQNGIEMNVIITLVAVDKVY